MSFFADMAWWEWILFLVCIGWALKGLEDHINERVREGVQEALEQHEADYH